MEERKELTIRIVMPREVPHWALVALLLASFPSLVGSETVTLQTYYPAPYGIYTQMRTTKETTLAENTDTIVEDGLASHNCPAGVDCNRVGIGNTNPYFKLDVTGSGRYTANLKVETAMGIGEGSNPSNPATNTWGYPGYDGSGMGDIMTLSVYGRVGASRYLYGARGNDCSQMTSSPGSEPSCGGGYATFTPGLRSDGYWYAPKPAQSTSYYGANAKIGIWTAQWDATSGWAGARWADPSEIIDFGSDLWWCCGFN